MANPDSVPQSAPGDIRSGPRSSASGSRSIWRSVAFWLGVTVLSLVFLVAGWEKAIDPQRFLMAIRTYELVNDPLTAWLAMGLPWLELLAALGLWWSRTRPGSLVVLNALVAVFLVAIISAWWRGLEIDCGCFGDVWRGGYPALVIQDVVLLTLGLALLWREWRRAGRVTGPAQGGNTAAAGATIGST